MSYQRATMVPNEGDSSSERVAQYASTSWQSTGIHFQGWRYSSRKKWSLFQEENDFIKSEGVAKNMTGSRAYGVTHCAGDLQQGEQIT